VAKCFAIFEGGGAKGLAHVGALKAAEEQKLEFAGIAGASAGAIIAVLIAAGYKADELYLWPGEPAVAQGLLATKDWTEFFDAAVWREFKELGSDIAAIPPKKGSPGLGTAWRARGFWKKWGKRLTNAAENRGLFSTQKFEEWIDEVLAEKLGIRDTKVTFEHLHNATLPNGQPTPPLKIVSVDIEAQKLVVYSHQESPQLPVAKAVAASISIPFFFSPTIVRDRNGIERGMVDGGLMSNFPAWLFEDERAAYPPSVRVYGFTLVESGGQQPAQASPLGAAKEYVTLVAQAGIFGGQTLSNMAVESLQAIPIETTFGVLDFELNPSEKKDLYEQGLESANRYFRTHGVADEKAVTAALEYLSTSLLAKLPPQTNGRLRANIILPVGRDQVTHLRVTYSYNMEDDADDRLLMSVDQTGCGEAFRRREVIYTDFRRVRLVGGTIPGLDKYDTALVRKDLVSMISVPVFRAEREWTAPASQRAEPLAVLSFDCNTDILTWLGSNPALLNDVLDFLQKSAILMGRLIQGLPLKEGS
jgi:predicted acylesterase/phospholipase RssA